MFSRFFTLAIALPLILAGCSAVGINQEGLPIATPDFVTATLPPTPSPAPTQTPLQPTPVPTSQPVEGTTTTQVNVRADTSTASDSLGVIPQFTTVQIIGRDASGNWYQIIYQDSGSGWVRAEFVRVDASAEITVIQPVAGEGSGVSGVILQRINVRSGPGRTYEALGILNPNDVVFVIGRDSGGGWVQIEFGIAPDGAGWVASEFIAVEDIDFLPIIGGEQTTEPDETMPQAFIQAAMQDGDSLQSPVAQVTLEPSGTRAIQLSGEVSAPQGDNEDWIEFRTDGGKVVIEVQCSSSILQVELWNNGRVTDSVFLACGETRVLTITPNSIHHLRIHEQSDGEFRRTPYTVKIERVH